jgi:hypothetical protein
MKTFLHPVRPFLSMALCRVMFFLGVLTLAKGVTFAEERGYREIVSQSRVAESTDSVAYGPRIARPDEVVALVGEQLITRRDLGFWLFETRLLYPETRNVPNEALFPDVLRQAVEEELLYTGLWDPTKEDSEELIRKEFEFTYSKFEELAEGKERLAFRLEEAGIADADFRPWLQERVERELLIQGAISDLALQEDSELFVESANSPIIAYKLREIHVRVANARPNQKPSEGEFQEAHAKIRQIYLHLADEMPFAKAARLFSEDEATALQGGQLGWFEKSQLGEDLLRELERTAKGGVTQPIRFPNGLSIYLLEDQRSEFQGRLIEVKELIKERLLKEYVQRAEIQTQTGYALTFELDLKD